MAGINIKMFAVMSGHLERVADGIKLHAGEPDFPSVLNEEKVRSARQTLENKREAYENFVVETKKAYEAYEAYYKECEKMYSMLTSAAHSFYGKKDTRLVDFGFKPWKTGRKSRSKE